MYANNIYSSTVGGEVPSELELLLSSKLSLLETWELSPFIRLAVVGLLVESWYFFLPWYPIVSSFLPPYARIMRLITIMRNPSTKAVSPKKVKARIPELMQGVHAVFRPTTDDLLYPGIQFWHKFPVEPKPQMLVILDAASKYSFWITEILLLLKGISLDFKPIHESDSSGLVESIHRMKVVPSGLSSEIGSRQ